MTLVSLVSFVPFVFNGSHYFQLLLKKDNMEDHPQLQELLDWLERQQKSPQAMPQAVCASVSTTRS